MSSRYRNPFKIRATEKLETENNFLRMYSPFVLEELIEKNRIDKLWKNVLFIRSSPGAGKTSILKVLEPASLNILSNSKSNQYYKDIIEHLKKMEVLDESGHVKLIGVYLNCARNYEVLEDLDISEGQKKGLFFALINARVILTTLKSILTLHNNVNLKEIEINASSFDYSFLDIKFPITGDQLFEWAASIEKSVFKAIDSFLPLTDTANGHSELFAFDLMQPSNITIPNFCCMYKTLFMFDDVHKLSRKQRQSFLDFLTTRRTSYNIWVAERLEALDEQKNFGSYKDRDYNEINLEEIWQGSNKLRGILANIAEKRASMSSEDVKAFEDFLEDGIREDEYDVKFENAANKALENISNVASYTNKFDSWINYLNNQKKLLTPLDFALLCRQCEILVYRTVGKSQLSFNFPLTEEELKFKLGGEIQTAARYFICMENRIPYYFGFDNLVRLASNNIEQFLSFAADLFEIMLARKISDNPITVGALEQERLLKKIADAKWREQSRLIPYADEVLKFLQNLAAFCHKETNKPNAPYAPGVNGFAIKDSQDKLMFNIPWKDDTAYLPLKNVLSTCISYNLIEKRITKQGKENQQWTVFYLNRWICLRFNLPFSYGGFRHKTPSELLKWIK